MAEGFLGRWSQRKDAVRKGKELAPEPEKEKESAARVPLPQSSPRGGGSQALVSPPPLGDGEGGDTTSPQPAPTLEDAQSLTKDSDFARFVKPDVAPEVKNTALKKLFADPHFNTMDGLDVYIDDYNKADPMPPEMLRKLASAKFLKLFDEPEEKADAEEAGTGAGSATVAQSDLCNELPRPQEEAPRPANGPDHADPDLRLQQDDAPGPEGPGAGPR